MVLVPMLRNCIAAAYPYIIVPQNILDKSFQRLNAPRSADNAAVQTYVQHLGRKFTFGIERIKTVFEIGKKLVATIKSLRRRKTHIVAVERVGNN